MNHASHSEGAQVGDGKLYLTSNFFNLYGFNPEMKAKTDFYERFKTMDDTNTLNVHIHALRQELAKHASAETLIIKTAPGLGLQDEKARGSQ